MPAVSVNYADVIELLENLGAIVKHERLERGLSRREMVEESGVSHNTVYLIEKHGHTPTTDVAIKLVRWLASG